ncbi:hypothetical protein EVAR_7359_1 [Eumeta japonica]|uniref:Uncharacterized protein n=1 Tax=Eumeta variegata TaxID=151549 RepID=A0A4C1T6A7_EUMVA|nr:hypothetical protein EVAR_7359_1 [Eumeta japonica]
MWFLKNLNAVREPVTQSLKDAFIGEDMVQRRCTLSQQPCTSPQFLLFLPRDRPSPLDPFSLVCYCVCSLPLGRVPECRAPRMYEWFKDKRVHRRVHPPRTYGLRDRLRNCADALGRNSVEQGQGQARGVFRTEFMRPKQIEDINLKPSMLDRCDSLAVKDDYTREKINSSGLAQRQRDATSTDGTRSMQAPRPRPAPPLSPTVGTRINKQTFEANSESKVPRS